MFRLCLNYVETMFRLCLDYDNPNWLLRAISTLGRDMPEQYFETKSHCTRRAILPALQNPVVRVSNQMLGHGWHNKLILYPLSNTWLCLEFSHVIPIQLYRRSKCHISKNPWGQLREGENSFLSILFINLIGIMLYL